MIRNETGETETSDSLTLSSREKNSSTKNSLAGSKRDVRAYLNSALRIKPFGEWTLAQKPKQEDAAFAHVFSKAEWNAFLEELAQANAVGLYVGVSAWGEVQNLEKTLRKILGSQCPRFSYPRLQAGSMLMEFAFSEFKDTVTSADSKWKSAPAHTPSVEPDVVFVPGLSMDTLGNRLGRGRGFYDRYLEAHPHARRIGTIHSQFVVEEFLNSWIEAHDQTLEVLWTERGIYRTPKFRPELNKELIS